MNKKLWLIPIVPLLLTGCETLVEKKDLDSVKEEYTQALSHLDAKVEDLRDEMNRKSEEQSKTMAAERSSFSEKLQGFSQQLRELEGKINELDYQLRESLNKNLTEQENKNAAFHRDIESLKQRQNELMNTFSSTITAFQTLQSELGNLKNYFNSLSLSLEKFTSRIQQLEKDYQTISEKMKQLEADTGKSKELILSELTRQESEMRSLKTTSSPPEKLILALKEEFASRMNTLVDELVRQESEIQSLRRKLGLVGSLPTEKDKFSSFRESLSYSTYTVKHGDSLTGIAKKYGTTTKELMEINKLKTKEVFVGQKLKVPTTR